jgi:hypothetical protein
MDAFHHHRPIATGADRLVLILHIALHSKTGRKALPPRPDLLDSHSTRPDFSTAESAPAECRPAERSIRPTARLCRVAAEADLLDSHFLSVPDMCHNSASLSSVFNLSG